MTTKVSRQSGAMNGAISTAPLASMVEVLVCNQAVVGSNPTGSSRINTEIEK